LPLAPACHYLSADGSTVWPAGSIQQWTTSWAASWAARPSGLLGRPSSTEAEPAAHKLHAPVRALEPGHEQALAPPPTAAEPARCRSPREARTAASTLASHRRSRAVAPGLGCSLANFSP